MLKLLALESSCDDFAFSILDINLNLILYSKIISNNCLDGIIPERAARLHAKLPWDTLNYILKFYKIDIIAVTIGPGLTSSLQVGVIIAKMLASFLKKPLIGINHIDAHILTPIWSCNIKPPFISIVISGGHSLRAFVDKDLKIHSIYNTKDDAAGNLVDKIARSFGIAKNEGPNLEKLALKGKNIYKIPISKNYFSFSGAKSFILNQKINKSCYPNWANSLFSSIAQATFIQIINALQDFNHYSSEKIYRIGISGGVAANSIIKDILSIKCKQHNLIAYFPNVKYCTDNAEMIAWLGKWIFKKNPNIDNLHNINVYPTYDKVKYWEQKNNQGF